MQPSDYERALAQLIEDLDGAMKALVPDWQVPSLKRAYVESEVYRSLLAAGLIMPQG